MLDARRIALQGLSAPFPLSVVAVAVQGLFEPAAIDLPAQAAPRRAAIVGRGPGTTINFSDYMAQLKRGHALPSVPAVAAPSRRRALKKRQRMEEEVFLLAGDF